MNSRAKNSLAERLQNLAQEVTEDEALAVVIVSVGPNGGHTDFFYGEDEHDRLHRHLLEATDLVDGSVSNQGGCIQYED